MFNALQPWHIIILVVVLIALFGAKRLPEAAKGIGKSMRVFKAEAKALRDDDETSEQANQSASQAHVAPPLPASTQAQQQQQQNVTDVQR